MKESEIIKGCINKDRKCQKAFVDTYSGYLFGVCRRYISDSDMVKDCLQESLVKILTNLDKYEARGQFKSWIAKVAAMECLQYLRKQKKHKFIDFGEIKSPIIQENISFELEQKDVMKFLDGLPMKYRIAINMYLIEGYSHKEIADKLGVSESSSRSLVTRGRKKIKELFNKDNMRVIHRNNGSSNQSYIVTKK